MTLKRLIKPLLLSCTLPLAFNANAEMNFMDKNNFLALSAGIDQPSVENNNASISSAKTTYIGSIEVGRKFYDRVSLSLEYKYFAKTKFNINNSFTSTNSFDHSWSVRSDTFMVNLAVDLIEHDNIAPYLKVGAGVSRNKSNEYKIEATNLTSKVVTSTSWTGKTVNRFAWQIGAGIDLKTSELLITNLSYNFVNRGKFETNFATDPSINSNKNQYTNLQDHVFTVGVKFKF